MEKFPGLREGQVALRRAELSTGIILDENYVYAVRDDQKVYSVFNDIDTALKIAQQIIAERNNIECVVCGQNGIVIEYLSSNK